MTEKRFTVDKFIEGMPVALTLIDSYVKELVEQGRDLADVTIDIHDNQRKQINGKGKDMTLKECCDLLNELHEENEQLKQALLFYLDLAVQDSSYLNDGFEKGMELWCQRLFNCSYSEMKKEYSEYKWADKWEMGE